MVVAPPFPGHRSDAGDEESAAADMGVRHRRRWRRFRAHGLDSFGVEELRDLAELQGRSEGRGEVGNHGVERRPTGLGLGFHRVRDREREGE